MAVSSSPHDRLPRIVRFLGTLDAPGSCCPHCGAEGRWIVRFVVDDGRTLGAMRGCVKLFPVSRVAREELRLVDKAKRYTDNGWQLNQHDRRALDACEAVAIGQMDERYALSIIDSAKRANSARFRRR